MTAEEFKIQIEQQFPEFSFNLTDNGYTLLTLDDKRDKRKVVLVSESDELAFSVMFSTYYTLTRMEKRELLSIVMEYSATPIADRG